MDKAIWAAGVDLGGTKIQVIQVNAFGTTGERLRIPTNVSGGPEAVEKDIVQAIKELESKIGSPPSAIGVGVAGQIDGESGNIKFAPNLYWKNVPLQKNLKLAFGVSAVVVNDVRAATWGEWLHGAGKGATDLLCIFIGTGIGGGIISDSRILEGFNNTAGEIGHMTVDVMGPHCTCGNVGCIEAFAGGWAITKRARDAAKVNKDAGAAILEKADGSLDNISGKHVTAAAKEGDPLAKMIMDDATNALAAWAAALVNAVGPQKVIFGGGVIEGSPDIVDELEKKIKLRALSAATENVEIVQAKLHNDAGAIGAGALANRMFVQ